MPGSPDAGNVTTDRLRCPRCEAVQVPAADGEQTCSTCRRQAVVLLFDPVRDDYTPAGATGRCARHPNKDAVAGCSRCGSFVCDVCATRTGEELYCTACFETLHERQHLSTTRASRMRWDDLTLGLGLLGLLPCVNCAGIPASLVIGSWTLFRHSRHPWISIPRTVAGMALSATMLFLSFLYIALVKR